MIITRKPLVVREVSEKIPSKITSKICIEKTQEQLKHRKSLAPVNMTKAVQWWLILKLANLNERLQLPPKHMQYLKLFFKQLCSAERCQRCCAIPWYSLWGSTSLPGKNCMHPKMIKHSSLCLGLTWMVFTVFFRHLLWYSTNILHSTVMMVQSFHWPHKRVKKESLPQGLRCFSSGLDENLGFYEESPIDLWHEND